MIRVANFSLLLSPLLLLLLHLRRRKSLDASSADVVVVVAVAIRHGDVLAPGRLRNDQPEPCSLVHFVEVLCLRSAYCTGMFL